MLLRTLLAADPMTVLGTSQPHDLVYQVDPRLGEWTRLVVAPADDESVSAACPVTPTDMGRGDADPM
ncbi:hypothetical protein [Actinokineospora alba]|nr:hypothetical protein [Actinokineospora alba]